MPAFKDNKTVKGHSKLNHQDTNLRGQEAGHESITREKHRGFLLFSDVIDLSVILFCYFFSVKYSRKACSTKGIVRFITYFPEVVFLFMFM